MPGPKFSAKSPTAGPGAPSTALRRRARVAAACAFACTGAWAQDGPNPYYIGLSGGVTHNTNINSVPNGPGDTDVSAGLVGGFDQLISRQHVYGSGNVSYNRYRKFSTLDNTSYGLNAGLDWQTINDLSGTVSVTASQGLANLQNNLLQQTSGRNLVRGEGFGGRVNWGGNGKLTLGGGYGYSQTHYTTPTLLAGDSNTKTADIGIYLHPGETLTLGTAFRYTRSTTDRAFLLADGTYLSAQTNGRNLDLTASWHPTALSGVNARISRTSQSVSSGGQGFSGLTGELAANYAATGKLSFTGAFSRDASTNGTFYNTFTGTTTTQPTVGLAGSSAVSNTGTVGATYAATAKVSVVAGASYRRTTQGNGSGVVNGDYRDAYTTYSLTANWAIRRFWSAGCSVSRAERRLAGSFNADYNGNIYSCSTQVTLR